MRSKKRSTEIFKKDCALKHNNFYNYDKTVYTNYEDKVTITCPIHNDFIQSAAHHLKGRGCSKCGVLKSARSGRKGKSNILKEFEKTHGDFYTYNLPEDIRVTDSIDISCPIHGIFPQIVNVHYTSGCPKCADIRGANLRRKVPLELERVVKNIKRRVKGFIKNEGYRKTSPTNVIIGIDWEGLQNYLESNLYGFKVGCGDLDIDHIVPLCSVKNEDDVYKLNHYTNLQLLPKIYNQVVKKEHPFNKEHFEKWLKETNYTKC